MNSELGIFVKFERNSLQNLRCFQALSSLRSLLPCPYVSEFRVQRRTGASMNLHKVQKKFTSKSEVFRILSSLYLLLPCPHISKFQVQRWNRCHVSLNVTYQQNSDGQLTELGEGINVTHILQSWGLIWQFCKVMEESDLHVKSQGLKWILTQNKIWCSTTQD